MSMIILDRDGVINRDSDEYIKSADEWLPIAGSPEAIAQLCQHGYKVYVISNQSGLGRKLFDMNTLIEIHQKMHATIEEAGGKIEAILFCPHHPRENCQCRKPEVGLYHELSARLGRDLNGVPMIGDSLRDLQAAEKMSGRPMLVRTGKGLKTLASQDPLLDRLDVFDDLQKCVNFLLEQP